MYHCWFMTKEQAFKRQRLSFHCCPVALHLAGPTLWQRRSLSISNFGFVSYLDHHESSYVFELPFKFLGHNVACMAHEQDNCGDTAFNTHSVAAVISHSHATVALLGLLAVPFCCTPCLTTVTEGCNASSECTAVHGIIWYFLPMVQCMSYLWLKRN